MLEMEKYMKNPSIKKSICFRSVPSPSSEVLAFKVVESIKTIDKNANIITENVIIQSCFFNLEKFMSTKKDRAKKLVSILYRKYETASTPLEHNSAWQLLVATILSGQSKDEYVNRVTPKLFEKYETVESFAEAEKEDVAMLIDSINFYNNKAKYIVKSARKIVEDFGGEVPDEIEDLVKLPGVARKTANVVLGDWFGKSQGFTVDTHVKRVSQRLKLTSKKKREKIEQDLMQTFPKDKWADISIRMVFFGREICQARKPECESCPMNDICPFYLNK
jgi:endonuclease-3